MTETTSPATSGSATSVTIPLPDDWHVHLRDDEMLAAVTPWTARVFRHALVMPNLVPPLVTTADAAAYRDRILAAAGPDALDEFTPFMTLYMHPGVDLDDLRRGVESGVVGAIKFYPAGATTNSEQGGDSILGFGALLEVMLELDLPLLVHAESTDPDIDIFDREAAFLEAQLVPLYERFPELRVTVEHLSTAAGVQFVDERPGVAGSITPHHLTCDRSHLLANGLQPDLYCKPIINSPADREALVAAALGGSPKFFLGTDSAPHPQGHKYTAGARPGIFNAPYALEVVAELFHTHDALDRLAGFASTHGADHYRLPVATDTLTLTRTEPNEPVNDRIVTADGEVVRVFGVDAAARWTITRD